MLIPEQLLQNTPQFVLVRNLQPKLAGVHIGCVDLAASRGEFLASGKTLDELRKLMPVPALPTDPEKRAEILARHGCDESEGLDDLQLVFHDNLDDHDDLEMFGVSYAIVLLGRDGDAMIDFIVDGLLEMKREQDQRGRGLNPAPPLGDPTLLTRPDEAERQMLAPSHLPEPESQRVNGGDLWNLWEAYVYRIVWWEGAAPEDITDRLTERINALPCGIEDDAWDQMDELLSK